jgi:phage anti-repressor protein
MAMDNFQRLDIVNLINNSPISKISNEFQTNLLHKIQENFTNDQQQLFVASFYTYLNYNSKTDFVIDLDNVWKWLGFSRKDPAKRVIEKHFTVDIDYKILLHNLVEQVHGGHNKEQVLLNIETFKSLCMLAGTENSKEVRMYYLKLEELLQETMKEESEALRLELERRNNEMQILETQNKEKEDMINLLTRKTNKFEPGESVYIFHSTIDDVDVYKVGRTKNANSRDAIHKTASYKGILLQVKCVDSVLLERVVHFLLDKYRCANRREWFNCEYHMIKNAIEYGKMMLEGEIDFNNMCLMDNTREFINKIVVKNEDKDINEQKEQDDVLDIFTVLEYKPVDINKFNLFLNEMCDEDINSSVSYTMIKNQYKIWSKVASHSQLQELIKYLKARYDTIMKRHNPLVSTSTLTHHFSGLKIKDSLFEFEKPYTDNCIIERFLYERCQRAPGYRATMQECFADFEKWYNGLDEDESRCMQYVIKEKLKNYLDIKFIRLRKGDESNGVDNRLGGWLGFALKTNNIPEPIKNYKPKNAKKIVQKDVNTGEIIKQWNSVRDASDYIKKSTTTTSTLIRRHSQIYIDNILSILEYDD